MRIPSRAASRLALSGGLGLAALLSAVAPAGAAVAPEKTLPGTTLAFAKAPNAADLRAAFRKSQVGQLFDDPAMKPLRDDVAAKMEDGSKALKEKIGVTIPELLELPQGAAWVAIQSRGRPQGPRRHAAVGRRRQERQGDGRGHGQGDQAGRGRRRQDLEEKFRDQTLHVIRSAKDEDKDAPP